MTDTTTTPAAALAAATQTGALPDAPLSLLGTLHGPNRARAVLRHRGRIETAGQGDRIGSATIMAIGEGVVIVASGGTTSRLVMPEYEKSDT